MGDHQPWFSKKRENKNRVWTKMINVKKSSRKHSKKVKKTTKSKKKEWKNAKGGKNSKKKWIVVRHVDWGCDILISSL